MGIMFGEALGGSFADLFPSRYQGSGTWNFPYLALILIKATAHCSIIAIILLS
jgi:hypothetical protein